MQEIKIPILNNEYKVIVCIGNAEFVTRVAKARGYEDADVEDVYSVPRRGFCLYGSSKQLPPLIALPRFPRTAGEIGTLDHEATHAVSDIWLYIREDLGGETFAHSVGAIVRETLKCRK